MSIWGPLQNPLGAKMGSKIYQVVPKTFIFQLYRGTVFPTRVPETCSWKRIDLSMHFGRPLAQFWYALGSSWFPFPFLLFLQFSMFSHAYSTDLWTEYFKACKCFLLDLQSTNKVLTKICQNLPNSNKINQRNAKHKLPSATCQYESRKRRAPKPRGRLSRHMGVFNKNQLHSHQKSVLHPPDYDHVINCAAFELSWSVPALCQLWFSRSHEK